LPSDDEVRQQVLDGLIDERAQLTTARETGVRVDDQELDRAVANVAQQNQITTEQLKERLRLDGTDMARFRNNVRDQLMVEHTREKEVNDRIKISDAEIDAQLDKQRAAAGQSTQYNIAQILIAVPEGASDAVVAERRARAMQVLSRVRSIEPFENAVAQSSDEKDKSNGGALGLRLASKLPDDFVAQVRNLKQGEVAPQLLRTSAGFHILKLVERREGGAFVITQTHARHILLRPSAQLTEEAAIRRLRDMKRTIQSNTRSFDAMARENSEDGSAPSGGDLGWQSPGSFVPEFEEAMNLLQPGGISDPVVSRFGVHLIQVLDRRQTTLEPRQQREQARNIIREQKFDAEFLDWQRELRARAYVEMREPPN
jgi:peptidyl-prolyl cis-trans isomerase SurA